MHPPVKDHVTCFKRNDDPGLDASDGAPIEEQDGTVTENKDHARQEFKDESDINYVLSKYGITQPREAPQYGTWDDSVDLQTALDSVREAREGFKRLPEELQRKFGTMEEFLAAVNNGSLKILSEDEQPPKETSAPKTEAPPAQ